MRTKMKRVLVFQVLVFRVLGLSFPDTRSRIPSHLFVNCYVAYHRVPYQGHSCMLCIQHQSLISLSLMISITTYMRMIHKFLSFFILNLNKTLCLVKSKLEACVKHIDSTVDGLE